MKSFRQQLQQVEACQSLLEQLKNPFFIKYATDMRLSIYFTVQDMVYRVGGGLGVLGPTGYGTFPHPQRFQPEGSNLARAAQMELLNSAGCG